MDEHNLGRPGETPTCFSPLECHGHNVYTADRRQTDFLLKCLGTLPSLKGLGTPFPSNSRPQFRRGHRFTYITPTTLLLVSSVTCDYRRKWYTTNPQLPGSLTHKNVRFFHLGATRSRSVVLEPDGATDDT